jgi:hypothetical protein
MRGQSVPNYHELLIVYYFLLLCVLLLDPGSEQAFIPDGLFVADLVRGKCSTPNIERRVLVI